MEIYNWNGYKWRLEVVDDVLRVERFGSKLSDFQHVKIGASLGHMLNPHDKIKGNGGDIFCMEYKGGEPDFTGLDLLGLVHEIISKGEKIKSY